MTRRTLLALLVPAWLAACSAPAGPGTAVPVPGHAPAESAGAAESPAPAGPAGLAGPTGSAESAATAGHAMPAPLLRLPPASLGRALTLQQSISADFTHAGRREHRELQVLLEANAQHTRLAAIGGGQVLARLDWDGADLRITRSPWTPDSVQPERILSDLQLSVWPADAIRGALPRGWTLDDTPAQRRLRQGDEVVVEIRYPDPATTLIEQRREGYRLTIRTLPAAPSGADQ